MEIQATYKNFSQNGRDIINGTESVQRDSPSNFSSITWDENLTETSAHRGTKVTSADGLTTINGQSYTQTRQRPVELSPLSALILEDKFPGERDDDDPHCFSFGCDRNCEIRSLNLIDAVPGNS